MYIGSTLSKGRKFLERLTAAADLQDEAIPRQPLIEIMGEHRVLIENHLGVVEYGVDQICVKASFGTISICGCGLELARMMKDQLIVSGRIDTVSLQRRRE